MTILHRWLSALVICLPGAASAQVPNVTQPVPFADAPLIDGSLGAAEWSRAVRVPLTGGGEILLQHDGRHLFVGARHAGNPLGSLCVAESGRIRVLHASAALGAVTYRLDGVAWVLDTAFVYELRERDASPQAEARRRAYLQAHGWLASNVYMGARDEMEYQIALPSPPGNHALIRIVLRPDGERDDFAVWPAEPSDDCSNAQLVRGDAPRTLTFRPEGWALLELRPRS